MLDYVDGLNATPWITGRIPAVALILAVAASFVRTMAKEVYPHRLGTIQIRPVYRRVVSDAFTAVITSYYLER